MKSTIGTALIGGLLFAGAALAAGPAVQEATQRDANQQERIEQGLQSGQLNTKEAGQLERQQSRIDQTEARDIKRDGKLTGADQAQINRMQNKASANIFQDRHNGVTGNPDSKSSERMQADVQRNVNQQQRIEQGERSGNLTNREAASLEHGQAKVDRKEANAAANGHVGAKEQKAIRKADNKQSTRIYKKKHNA